jgi:hypothetical protein
MVLMLVLSGAMAYFNSRDSGDGEPIDAADEK